MSNSVRPQRMNHTWEQTIHKILKLFEVSNPVSRERMEAALFGSIIFKGDMDRAKRHVDRVIEMFTSAGKFHKVKDEDKYYLMKGSESEYLTGRMLTDIADYDEESEVADKEDVEVVLPNEECRESKDPGQNVAVANYLRVMDKKIDNATFVSAISTVSQLDNILTNTYKIEDEERKKILDRVLNFQFGVDMSNITGEEPVEKAKIVNYLLDSGIMAFKLVGPDCVIDEFGDIDVANREEPIEVIYPDFRGFVDKELGPSYGNVVPDFTKIIRDFRQVDRDKMVSYNELWTEDNLGKYVPIYGLVKLLRTRLDSFGEISGSDVVNSTNLLAYMLVAYPQMAGALRNYRYKVVYVPTNVGKLFVSNPYTQKTLWNELLVHSGYFDSMVADFNSLLLETNMSIATIKNKCTASNVQTFNKHVESVIPKFKLYRSNKNISKVMVTNRYYFRISPYVICNNERVLEFSGKDVPSCIDQFSAGLPSLDSTYHSIDETEHVASMCLERFFNGLKYAAGMYVDIVEDSSNKVVRRWAVDRSTVTCNNCGSFSTEALVTKLKTASIVNVLDKSRVLLDGFEVVGFRCLECNKAIRK